MEQSKLKEVILKEECFEVSEELIVNDVNKTDNRFIQLQESDFVHKVRTE